MEKDIKQFDFEPYIFTYMDVLDLHRPEDYVFATASGEIIDTHKIMLVPKTPKNN